MNFSVVVLTGGASSRMGRDKASLTYEGESFLERLCREFSNCNELLISGLEPPAQLPEHARFIADEVEGRGPAEGVLTALKHCSSDLLVTLGCDMPLYNMRFALKLTGCLAPWEDAIVPKTPDGRLHMIGAAYRKRCAPQLLRQMQNGCLCLRHMLPASKTGIYRADTPEDMRALRNINTPQDYIKLLEELK